MESEDENFIWTDASTESNNDSLSMAITKENGADDSESGYSYKKKVQNELFESKHCIKEEIRDSKKSKKRKHEDLDSSATDIPKSKQIKREPESDLDVHSKMRKSNISESDSISKEEEFLNLKVKEEQSLTENISSKSKKKNKNKHRHSSPERNMCTSSLGESQSIVFENHQCDNDTIVNISDISQKDDQLSVKKERPDTDSDRTKKKKSKKRKKDRPSIEDTIIEDKLSAVDTIVEQRTLNVYQSENTTGEILNQVQESYSLHDTNGKSNEYSDDNLNGDGNDNSISMIESSNLNIDKRKSENFNNSTDKIISSNSTNDLTKTITKISDRIRFEEDTLSFSQDVESNNKLESSNKLKRFLKINNHLKQISPTVQGDAIITNDDEVWVLKCPSDVNVNSLKDTNLVLDNKCKLKADNQTCVGFMDNNVETITILTIGQSKPVVKNVRLSGTVHFRKRIPKPHYVEHNFTENNQTNFIPLLETKNRHPLFGSDYKRAIKVPKSIALRLNGHEPELIPDGNEKKKKKKKHKKEVIVSDNEQNTKLEQDHVEVRKKKKRKHSHNDEAQSKFAKKLKHDPENWESEQAIEQQLFNF